MLKGKGVGYYFRDRIGTKVRIELDNMPEQALLKSTRGEAPEEIKTLGFDVADPYRTILEEQGFFVENWLTSEKQTSYPGYEYYTPQDPLYNGKLKAWILKDNIKFVEGKKADGTDKTDLVGPEGIEHFSPVCFIAGWMRKNHFPEPIEINPVGKPDITWGDKEGCFEFERPGTHNSVEAWENKLKRAKNEGYKHIIFTGNSTVCSKMSETVVSGYVYPQGKTYLLKELEKIRDEYITEKLTNLEENVLTQEA